MVKHRICLCLRICDRMRSRMAETSSESSEIPKYSLNQVRKDLYLQVYNRLKKTYVLKLKKSWNEKTDPDKFIHEDVGISSYLMALWNFDTVEADQRPDFIDIGCGNGLLTYLLACEGFKGFGFDIRERKIWKLFEPQPKLIVSSFSPNNDELLQLCSRRTWLIGNHPDELTPWIPVLARKYTCNFIVIPCCAYDFVGKYKRESSKEGTSVYLSYLHYIKNLATACGFKVAFDKLRIPSTKRVCIIGTLDEETLADLQASQAAMLYCEQTIHKYSSHELLQKFEPRCAVEPVRNCTKIGRAVVENTVKILFDYLVSDLDEKNNVPIQHFPEMREKSCKVVWNAGKQDVTIKDAIRIIPSEYLKEMKSQHGGFQTLIRNHGHVFRVVDGFVRLRQPQWDDIEKVQDPRRIRSRSCYLYNNHPNRCPLPAEMCRFQH